MKLKWEKVAGSLFRAQKARMKGFVLCVETTKPGNGPSLWGACIATREDVYLGQRNFDGIREAKQHCQRLADAMAAFGKDGE